MKLTEDLIKEAQQQSYGKAYPVYVKNLKAIGVDHYTVDVSKHIIDFVSASGQELSVTSPFPQLTCADHFNINGIKLALKRVQNSETDYPGFLEEIAAAGCHTYLADLAGMKVIYKGKQTGQEYVEQIPVVA